MNTDHSLADTTPQDQTPAAPGLSDAAVAPLGRQMSVEEILDIARTPEARASVCLRGDLEAEYDEILEELLTLVDPDGNLIVDPEASVADESKAGRAQELSDRLDKVRSQMQAAMWRPLFRGMPTDDFEVFQTRHLPKAAKAGDQVDLNDYYNRLIAATAVDPEMSVDDVIALRGKLGVRAVAGLVRAAESVCTGGGVDVPKSPTWSLVQKGSKRGN